MVAIKGVSDPPSIPASVKAKEAPVYLTLVGNNSAKAVPIKPYDKPINIKPM